MKLILCLIAFIFSFISASASFFICGAMVHEGMLFEGAVVACSGILYAYAAMLAARIVFK